MRPLTVPALSRMLHWESDIDRMPLLVREVFRRGTGGLEIERPPVNTQAAGQPYRVPSQPEAGGGG